MGSVMLEVSSNSTALLLLLVPPMASLSCWLLTSPCGPAARRVWAGRRGGDALPLFAELEGDQFLAVLRPIWVVGHRRVPLMCLFPVCSKNPQDRASFGKVFPNCGKVFPDCGKVFPDFGKVFPDFGKVFPDCGKVFPELGKAFPNLGKVFPDCGKVFPNCGKVGENG